MAQSDKKLVIVRGRTQGKQAVFDQGNNITICFNPTEYSIEKTNAYGEATIPGLDSPIIQYAHGNTRTLTLELVVDTITYDNSEDVRAKYISKFETLLTVDPHMHAPPPCRAAWGTLHFVC